MTTLNLPDVEYVKLSNAIAFFPGRPNAATLWRWATRGARGVKLRTVVVGTYYMTCRQWCEDFMMATAATMKSAEQPAPFRSRRARKQAIKSAKKALDRAGIHKDWSPVDVDDVDDADDLDAVEAATR